MRDALLWHLKQIAIAVDQLVNTLLGGWADETLSSRCWRWDKDGVRSWPRTSLDWLFRVLFRDPDHCRESYLSERDGDQLSCVRQVLQIVFP